MKITYVIMFLSVSSALIPLVTPLVRKGKIENQMRTVIWLVAIALCCDVLSIYLGRSSVNTYPIGNLYLTIQFFMLYFLFYLHFEKSKILRVIFIASIIFYFLNFFFIQGPNVLNSFSNAAGGLILIGISLYYLYSLLHELPTLHIYRLPLLWVTFAILLYYAGTFFIFLFNNFFDGETKETYIVVWAFHNILNISKNILFAVAVWQSYHKTT